uniref:Uncharacterized protein n=1 Tax=Arundo donax TaxID=35708 RepID=A0A0A8YCA8_ARUDO
MLRLLFRMALHVVTQACSSRAKGITMHVVQQLRIFLAIIVTLFCKF